ncbi:YggT family protein [Agromyces atrinae]|uniref:YggT family protein n=1 Tax=Agromyces atrinae TaxID=592376 RepID=A0A4Q2MB51_9MICO|nr:YggT family protein [Agromyces atrinae]MCI2958819.1 YggT family protein [Agromyces atrinae]NYD65955.1 YggT family protein [Agromyces atrinae]RXZ86290.1 YggT family protein [Agromyces atrinae]
MGVIQLVASILYYVLLIYFFMMWARFILDLIQNFNRSWRPRGGWVVAVELVYTLTDPPVKFFRRLLPPLRLGGIALDFGWSIAMLTVIIAMSVVSWIAR